MNMEVNKACHGFPSIIEKQKVPGTRLAICKVLTVFFPCCKVPGKYDTVSSLRQQVYFMPRVRGGVSLSYRYEIHGIVPMHPGGP